MLTLRTFESADDDVLIGWFPDEQALRRWAGPGPSWPLDRRQLARRRADPAVLAWTAYLDGAPDESVGHIELERTGPGQGRIDRVAIAPEHRGRRLAGVLVRAALDEARALGVEAVDLLVFAGNHPAIRTYRAVGFADRGAIAPDYPDVRRMELNLGEP